MHKAHKHIETALNKLREVEQRAWHDILLSAPNPTDEAGEMQKLFLLASAYQAFNAKFSLVGKSEKQEAYAVLCCLFRNRQIPPKGRLTREHFDFLLDAHLERLG